MSEDTALPNDLQATWIQTLETLASTIDESWDGVFERANQLVSERLSAVSQCAVDDYERLLLIQASGELFKAKVARWGYDRATQEFAGPARGSSETRERGLVHANGTDIENPT